MKGLLVRVGFVTAMLVVKRPKISWHSPHLAISLSLGGHEYWSDSVGGDHPNENLDTFAMVMPGCWTSWEHRDSEIVLPRTDSLGN